MMAAKARDIILTLFESGETIWRREGRLHGVTDLPLSGAGRSAVVADTQSLSTVRFSTLHHPKDESATETAQLIAGAAGCKTKAIAGLADPNLGLLEGLLEQDLSERYPKRYRQWREDPGSLVPPEGEAFNEARVRILKAVARLFKRSRSEGIGLVLHPIALGMLRCWLADAPLSSLWEMMNERPRVEVYALPVELVDRLLEEAVVESAAGA